MELCFAPLWILKKRKKQAPSGFAVGGEIILVSKCYCLYDSGSQFTSFTTEREWESLRGDAGECCSRSGLHGAHSANIRMTPVFGLWVKDDNVQLGLCCSDSYFFLSEASWIVQVLSFYRSTAPFDNRGDRT